MANLDFDAKEMDQNCLGWIVEAKKIQLDIWKKLDSESVSKITASPTGLSILGDGIELEFENESLNFEFLIGADGVNSFVRNQLGIPLKKVSSRHHALASIVRSDSVHDGVALQKFLDAGPSIKEFLQRDSIMH